MTAYIRHLKALAEAESSARLADIARRAREEALATREKLVPLGVRLQRLLETIPHEVQAEGLSLEALRKMLRGSQGGGAHCGELGQELRRQGWRRVRSWKSCEGGFCAKWFPPE